MNKRIIGFIMSVVMMMCALTISTSSVYAAGRVKFTSYVTIGVDSDDGDTNIVFDGQTLSVGYTLNLYENEKDLSEISWLSVDDNRSVVVQKKTVGEENADKYLLKNEDVGKTIKVVVKPKTSSGRIGSAIIARLENTVNRSSEKKSDNTKIGKTENENTKTKVFIAGDSTVKSYGEERDEGGWGEFINNFFDDDVIVDNRSNGGRSTRNFINEGSLEKIKNDIGAGDYLFIQFAHNDCSDGESNIIDRYVPLGDADANGIYPIIAGEESTTVDSGLTEKLLERYGDEFYPYTSGTYKWYLKQYIDVAKNAGATPVLVTPVSRMKFDDYGKIAPHHDDSKSRNNAYVTAMKQLAEEENVLCIDLFEVTKNMYENFGKERSLELQFRKDAENADNTHYNKFGGLYVASLMAGEIENSSLPIAKCIVKADNKALEAALDHTENKAAVKVDITDEMIKEYEKSNELLAKK
ncbi:MAG: rhamnogalacturonan acetylesterase [Firmicutes bacterium]|nr:rhamnogalacturonan acetylesterase [Bacillota bacterium]